MSVWRKAWFWLLILSIIVFLVFIIVFEWWQHSGDSNPEWIWILLALGVVLFLVSIALYAYDSSTESTSVIETYSRSEVCPTVCETKETCPVRPKCNKVTEDRRQIRVLPCDQI